MEALCYCAADSYKRFIKSICGQLKHLRNQFLYKSSAKKFPLSKAHTPPSPLKGFLTHLCKCCVLIQAQSYISLGQRCAPQHRDVQGKEKKSQEQQQFCCQSHHPFDAAALRSLRCGRSSDSASSRCRDSNLRIRRGRGAATPLRSHFGNQNCKNEGKRIGWGGAVEQFGKKCCKNNLDPAGFL